MFSFFQKHLDIVGLAVLTGYAVLLVFAVLDDYLGWEILIDYF